MFLTSLDITNIRNFQSKQCEFSRGITLFIGPNAAGKTNLLEAIHLLSNLRSFRTHALRETIQWDEREAYIRGIIQSGGREQDGGGNPKTLAVGLKANARIPAINSKICKSSKDYLRILPSATFVPDDLSLVKGAPAFRRYFLDHGTFQFFPAYWALLTDYNRVLQQKNALLKTSQKKPDAKFDAACDVWDAQLQALGSKIIVARLDFLSRLRRQIQEVYARWLGTDETAALRYECSLGIPAEEIEIFCLNESELERHALQRIANCYEQAIARHRDRERRLGVTLIGPHRDDLDVLSNGRLLRAYGSQGQQRTAVLAMKLAEIQVYYEQYGEYPILLLDDVTSELDMQRNTKLFEYLQQGMQVFLTATDRFALGGLPCEVVEILRNGS
ncbi:DNA replication and repair protein RecF [Candidatus Moduliflexus flocculans]|uniref:DNA replication and repair protein RecF n=1 Tax=Candidatus Moduliflexus flocculans TaxID=1499966 RepID=A0A0S6VQC1_9BACT|nr:DNA replication and repair protein RecF [Candidatus Moduliflexus flocculans]